MESIFYDYDIIGQNKHESRLMSAAMLDSKLK